jgi:glycosyltransferase involved in cell wall biosynthesis
MRVLQAMAGAQYGGAERFFERMVPALSRAGLVQRVLIRSDSRRAKLLSDAGMLDLDQLAFGGGLDLLTRFRLRRHISSFKPDVLFTWMNRASSYAPKKTSLRRSFAHIGRLGGYYDLKYYRNCDWLVADTLDLVEYLTGSGWPADRVSYLPNFVDGTPGKPIAPKSLFIPEYQPIILALGRLHTNKGFDVLLKAMALLPNAYLLLAGDGPERERLEQLATQLGVKPRIRFLGWREDVSDLLASARIFVHPARHEPLGNVVIEAWAQGVPVVATAAKGPEALIKDNVNGRLVPIDDSTSMARAIGDLLTDSDQSRKIAEAGRQTYLAHYTEANVVAQYIALFERVVAECVASPGF